MDHMSDPERAAALEGLQANPVARTYQLGFAAGELAALRGLRDWVTRRATWAHGVAPSPDEVLAEIDRRLPPSGAERA